MLRFPIEINPIWTFLFVRATIDSWKKILGYFLVRYLFVYVVQELVR